MYPLHEESGGTELTAFWIGSIFYAEIGPLWYYKTTDRFHVLAPGKSQFARSK